MVCMVPGAALDLVDLDHEDRKVGPMIEYRSSGLRRWGGSTPNRPAGADMPAARIWLHA